MRIMKSLVLASVLLAFAIPVAARAQTCNNQFIGAIFNGYTAINVTSLAFGAYSPANASAAQSNVQVTAYCTGGLLGATLPPFTLAMSAGGGSFTQRKMAAGGATLKYQIYTSAADTTVWGDGTGATSTVAGGNNGVSSQTITGYGVIPVSQYVTPGSYTDTITVTITY